MNALKRYFVDAYREIRGENYVPWKMFGVFYYYIFKPAIWIVVAIIALSILVTQPFALLIFGGFTVFVGILYVIVKVFFS